MQVTYAEVAEQALGPVGKTVVEIQLVLSQTGFCVAYIVFIYSTLSPAVVPLSATSIVLLVLPLQVTSISLPCTPSITPLSSAEPPRPSWTLPCKPSCILGPFMACT